RDLHLHRDRRAAAAIAPRAGGGAAGVALFARVSAAVRRAGLMPTRAEEQRDGEQTRHGSVNLTVASYRLRAEGSAPITRRKNISPCACAAATCGAAMPEPSSASFVVPSESQSV